MAPVDSRDYVLSGIYYSVLVQNNCGDTSTNTMLTQCWSDAGPPSATLYQHQTSTGSTPHVCWAAFNLVKAKHLYNFCTMLDQRRRRWADVVQMLYKCFIFARSSSWSGIAYCCDSRPALNQHWFNASCLLGCVQPSKNKTFV